MFENYLHRFLTFIDLFIYAAKLIPLYGTIHQSTFDSYMSSDNLSTKKYLV